MIPNSVPLEIFVYQYLTVVEDSYDLSIIYIPNAEPLAIFYLSGLVLSDRFSHKEAQIPGDQLRRRF